MKAAKLELSFQPSWQLVFILFVTHSSALLILLNLNDITDLYVNSRAQNLALLVMMAIIIVSLSISVKRALLKHPEAITQLQASTDKDLVYWKLTMVNGSQQSVTLVGPVLVWPSLIACRFLSESNERYHLLMLSDSLPRQQHRLGRAYFLLYGA